TIVGLGKSRRVIAPDQIGHGRSDKPSLKYRVTDFVDYIEEFVDQLRLSQIDIIGNSLGGWIGARLAIKRPDLVKKLVLVAAGGLKPSSEFRREIEKFDFTMSSLSSTRFMLEKSFYNKQRYASTFTTTLTYIFRRVSGNQEIIRTIIKSADEPSEWIDKKLEKIEAETLVLWGREDRILPIDFVEKFAQGIPNVKVEILENCGHVPQIERAKDFNRLVEEFLKSSR
ncbi:MAG: alpha/beta hydrolase, partial [Blastocatellia bacterium]|nr:alpha/beta hydrolase [Blastocatellia bacterium]